MEKERVEKTKTKEEKKLTEEKAAKVRGKRLRKQRKSRAVTQDQYRYEDLFLYGGHGDLLFGRCFC